MKIVGLTLVFLVVVNLLGGCVTRSETPSEHADSPGNAVINDLPKDSLNSSPKPQPQLPDAPDINRNPESNSDEIPPTQESLPPDNSASTPDSPPEPAPDQEKPKEEAARPSQLEVQMLELVNKERERAGEAPFTISMVLTEVARVKSIDMIENNYFNHQSPVYGSPFEMLSAFGVNFHTAGENIALYQGVEAAHQGLMNSPGHRENILRPEFSQIGIGIIRAADGRLYITQLFIG